MSTYLFAVDEKNKPLQQRFTRSKAHLHLIWHRTTHIWVMNPQNKLLLVKRGSWKSQDPGNWASYIGGHALYGESYEECALREIKEEIGIEVAKERLIPLYLNKSKPAKEFSQYFLFRLKGNEKIIPTKKEFTKYKYLKPSLIGFRKIGDAQISGGLGYIKFQIEKLKELNFV